MKKALTQDSRQGSDRFSLKKKPPEIGAVLSGEFENP